MPDCCALKDIWRQLLTLIFHQTFNFKINMRQQCDFNEMYINANIQRINLCDLFFKKENHVFYCYICKLIYHLYININTVTIIRHRKSGRCTLTWKAGKHDDIFFECSMMENRLHLSLMTHQDLSLGHDVFDTIWDLGCTFMYLGINLTSFISPKRKNRYSI